MAPKQASLFDFFEEPALQKVQQKKAVAKTEPIPQLLEPIVINEIPVEVEFIATPLAVSRIITETVATEKKSTRGRKKLSEPVVSADLLDIPTDDILFQKKYYSIGIVAEMFKVNISHIRFWEKEFDILKPKLNGKGDRHFRPEDIKNLKLIHHLVKEKKYTIEGARDFLKNNKRGEEIFAVIEELKRTKLFLNELKMSL
jgi:DNA-binding transcriptional MerR regulator